jgi:hypothetical protein
MHIQSATKGKAPINSAEIMLALFTGSCPADLARAMVQSAVLAFKSAEVLLLASHDH